MDGEILVMGYGAVGSATVQRLWHAGRPVAVAQRVQPADLPTAVRFVCCDVLDAASVQAALAGFAQVVVAIGFPYDGRTWLRDWPVAMANLLAAGTMTGARLVFVDNLYIYGPQTEPLVEDMPLTDFGRKPAARAAITRQWQAAAAAGRVRIVALRVSDFYGPQVRLSQLGDVGFAALAAGKAATLVAPPDTLHDFAYVPDVARAVETLLNAPDDVYGQAWHMPSAPTLSPRRILTLGAEAAGINPRIRAVPLRLLPLLGLVTPVMRELAEMRFQWDRPYRVDASKWTNRFWSDVTPFEDGAAATIQSFR